MKELNSYKTVKIELEITDRKEIQYAGNHSGWRIGDAASQCGKRPSETDGAGCGPFLEYVLQGLKKSGIDDVIFAVGYKGGMVEEYFGDGSQFGIRARYAYEEELLGTAGAIKNAGNYVTDEQFFVLNGDTFYQMDFGDLSRIQQEKNLEMALVLRGVPDISRYGAARLTDGLLTAFNEKNGNTGAGTINGGVYLMKRALLDEIPEGKVSLENECIPRWMQEGRRLGGIVNDGYFIDIGVPEDYFRFQEDVRKGDITW